jgi:hypothetical protein
MTNQLRGVTPKTTDGFSFYDEARGEFVLCTISAFTAVACAAYRLSAFTPAVPGDWSGPPATVQAALDELAARVAVLEP